MKFYLLLLGLALVTNASFGQENTYIPDDNFEQALIDLGYDSGPLDDYVLTATIDTVSALNLSFKMIEDITGISDFSALTFLDCNFNLFFSLDVSGNLYLKTLLCAYGEVSNLNVLENVALEVLECHHNSLFTLNLNNCTQLKRLITTGNAFLDGVDLSQNTALTFLEISNPFASVDLTNNILLDSLFITYTEMTELDLSENNLLTFLNCEANYLEGLNLMNLPNLKALKCGFNNLSHLDLSQNTNLESVDCRNNELLSLNVHNGNNTSILDFKTENNADLSCVEVDNVTWSNSNWLAIDPTTYFSELCGLSVGEAQKENKIVLYPNPFMEVLQVNVIQESSYVITSVNGEMIFTGKLLKGENQLNLAELEKGIYYMAFWKDNLKKIQKIVKI